MRKLICGALLAVFILSFVAGATAQNMEPPPCWNGIVACVWRCHMEKGELYNCCEFICPGGSGKMFCTLIGYC